MNENFGFDWNHEMISLHALFLYLFVFFVFVFLQTDLPNSVHAFQTAERIRQKFPDKGISNEKCKHSFLLICHIHILFIKFFNNLNNQRVKTLWRRAVAVYIYDI